MKPEAQTPLRGPVSFPSARLVTGGGAAQDGMTLLEIIVVLVIIGVVTVVLFSRVSRNSAEFKATAELIKTHLRYAQSRAMSSRYVWGIVFSANGYVLFKDADADQVVDQSGGDDDECVELPGETDVFLALPSSMNLTTATAETNWTVSFDDRGRPYNGVHEVSADPMVGTTGGKTFQLTMGGEDPIEIEIVPETGFVR